MEFSSDSNILQRLSRDGTDFLAQLEEASSCMRWADILVLNEARFNRAIATKKLEMPLNTWFAGKCIT